MAASKKRRLAENEINEITNDSQSDLPSEDELVSNFSSISIDSSDEEDVAERKWQCGTFIPMIPEFNGHHLYIDNWYTSPALFELLHRNKTGACGTVHENRQGLPSLATKLRRGESQHSHTNVLLALKWKNKREVHMLSTIHSPSYTNTNKIDRQTGEVIRKPVCILEYSKNMGAVDDADMQISFSECIRKSINCRYYDSWNYPPS
ncbi:unnamed protein product [Rotaria sordida]|uniref:PiggyBac transposable element-derived protein domain-containing protein n=1 Tax=Rotaria sordida TaxID=392033 RepID=A0A818UJM7_9BILA|nr:unnamed protein product [Rotaria sordida]